jgi:DNA-binding response OmpR family regulator
MPAALTAGSRSLLLLESQHLLRRTVSSVARELELARVQEALSVDEARRLIDGTQYDAMLIDLDGPDAIELLARVRSGESLCVNDIPIAVTTSQCSADTARRLRELAVRRVLLKPFKVRAVLETIELLLPKPAQA